MCRGLMNFISLLFKPKNDIDPFEPYDDLETEQEIMDEIKHSSSYRKFMKTLYFFLDLCSISLVSIEDERKNPRPFPVKDTLAVKKFSTSTPKLLKNCKCLQAIWQSRRFRVLIWLILLYWTLKFELLELKHFEHGFWLKKQRSLLETISGNNSCIRLENSTLEYRDLETKINITRKWLYYLGDPSIIDGGGPIMLYGFISWSIFLLFITPLLQLKHHPLLVDYLAFLTDPLGHRSNIKADIEIIMRETLESLENHVANIKLEIQRSCRSSKPQKVLTYLPNLYGIQSHLLVFQSNLIRPSNLSSCWFKRALNDARYALTLSYMSAVFWAANASTFMYTFDWYLRVVKRLEDIKCQQSISNTTYLNNLAYLGDSQLSKIDLQLYENHDNSLSHLLYLVFVVEPKYTLTCWNVWTIIENIMIYYGFAAWIVTYVVLFFLTVGEKLYWLQQIRGQLDFCISYLIIYKEKKNCTSRYDDGKVIKMLLIAYVNYVLFKRRYRTFQLAISSFGVRCMSYVPLMIGATYIGITYTNSTMKAWMRLGVFFFLIQINLWFVTAALVLNRITSVMKSMTSLVANGSFDGGQNQLDFLINLWRHQLLGEEEINHFFAGNLFGKYFTFEQIVSLDGYLLGWWLLL